MLVETDTYIYIGRYYKSWTDWSFGNFRALSAVTFLTPTTPAWWTWTWTWRQG